MLITVVAVNGITQTFLIVAITRRGRFIAAQSPHGMEGEQQLGSQYHSYIDNDYESNAWRLFYQLEYNAQCCHSIYNRS